jgi:hypothetical protein
MTRQDHDSPDARGACDAGARGNHQLEPVESDQALHTRGRGRIVMLAVAAAGTVVASLIAARIGAWAFSDRSGSDGWATASAREMSISLPRSFVVTTDADDYAELLAGVGASELDQFAEVIEQFPDLFALAAVEKRPGDEAAATVEVLRVPGTGESLDESADALGEGLEAGGVFQITGESERVVGTGRYAAARIAFEGNWPGQPAMRSVAYLVDGGSQLWVVEFNAPSEEYDSLSGTFDRSIATLTLPTPADDDEEDGDGQR